MSRAPNANAPASPRVDFSPRAPHARLGLAWAAVTLVSAIAGPWALAVWLAVVGGLAAVQAARSWRGSDRPPPAAAAVAVVAVVLGAAAGPLGAVAGAAFASLVTFAAHRGWRRSWRDPLGAWGRSARSARSARSTQGPAPARRNPIGIAIPIALGIPCASVVLLRQIGVAQAVVLLALVSAYDASCYVVGSGATNAWEGPAAGVASIGAVTLAVAAVLVPPFRGASPWILGATAALLAPLGPRLASVLVGESGARVQGVRRLDSLIVLGPAWTLLAWLLIG